MSTSATLARLACLLFLTAALFAQEPTANLLVNGSFEDPPQANGCPAGWSVYAGVGETRRLVRVDQAHDGDAALLIDDDDGGQELGITQTVPAEGGLVYKAAVWVHAWETGTTAGSYLQMRFLPSNTFRQVSLTPRFGGDWREVKVTGLAPDDTQRIVLYLYCHRDPTPKLVLDQATLIGGAEMEDDVPPPPIPPTIDKLKDLHLTTALVADGQPAAAIVAAAEYAADVKRLNAAIQKAGGVALPVIDDSQAAAEIPIGGLYDQGLTRNLICLGNRSTSAAISKLYDQYYTLLDLKYPGAGGWVLRSLHDPFGDGHNVLFCGGSDAAGVTAATDALIQVVLGAPQAGDLSVGRLMDIHLPEPYQIPEVMRDVGIWDASAGYGSSGYFGWNSISKRMALYYMTGDEASAREFLRLAFPDQQAKDELAATDGEMIENKDAPLSGPYHYNAHMMTLYWDLIEESPVFTAEERLKVVNALAQQLNHRKDEGIYSLSDPPGAVGSRHGQWSAMSLYCLGRYLEKSYPNPIWKQCVKGAQYHFGALEYSSWVAGESDNLFWYTTGTAPILAYLVISGERTPLKNGVLAELLQGQEVLASGRVPDWTLRYGAISYYNQAAYLTADGRWITYRNRAENDTDVFRLGQSFWPADIQPAEPADMAGHWTVQPLPAPAWNARGNGFPFEESYYFASYRSRPDAGGDFILLDGFNGASRNPYHTFAILELRIGGQNILQAGNGAYLNQLQTKADGMVEPKVAMDAALRYHGVVGQTITAVGEVPEASFANWRRTLAQRLGKYALVVDDLTWEVGSQNLEAATSWQTRGLRWNGQEQAIEIPIGEPAAVPPGWTVVRATDCEVTSDPAGPDSLINVEAYDLKLLRATEPGQWIEMRFTLGQPFTGHAYADLVNYEDRGTVSIALDGQTVAENVDHYSGGVLPMRVPLGQQTLAPGPHTLRVTGTGRHGGAARMFIGLGGISLQPDGAPSADQGAATWAIRASDPLPVQLTGDVATETWRGAGEAGGHWIGFNLLASDQSTACLRLAPNAAVLKVPQPAIASVGQYGASNGELVIAGADHLYALRATSAGLETPMLTASEPVSADWDYATGKLAIEAIATTTVSLAAKPDGLTLDGQPVSPRMAGNRIMIEVPLGKHMLTAQPSTTAALDEAVAKGLAMRQTALADAAKKAVEAPALPAAWTAQVGGRPAAVTYGGEGAGLRLYAAVEKAVHVLDGSGKELAVWPTDGPIRVLHWWPETGLLIAGCTDEQVIAFTSDGQRKWVFTSVMDPAVFRAAKQYWFKTAPGHEGIHGLGSGKFIDGREQLFVGSACTLEILETDGTLATRMPVFWGPGNLFKLIDGPDGAPLLLIGRWPNGTVPVGMVSAKNLSTAGRGFHSVPAGHTYVGGWGAQNRSHLFYTDLDGDGEQEVVSEINGTWNRVTVWDKQGNAKASANFGPGPKAPTKTVRDLEVLDLDGDGQQELVTALADGLLIALNTNCERVWSYRLPSPAAATCGLPGKPGRVLCAVDDGQVLVVGPDGKPAALGTVPHRPQAADLLPDGRVVVTTQAGELVVFAP